MLLEIEIEDQRKALEPARLERERAKAQIVTQRERQDTIEVGDIVLGHYFPAWLKICYRSETCWTSRQDSKASRSGQGSLGEETSADRHAGV